MAEAQPRQFWPLLFPYKWEKGYSAVYLIKNIVNNKIYIGITKKPPPQRKSAHFSDAKVGRKTKICRAIRKYGRENFVFYMIGYYRDYALTRAAEYRWIAALKPTLRREAKVVLAVCSGVNIPRKLRLR